MNYLAKVLYISALVFFVVGVYCFIDAQYINAILTGTVGAGLGLTSIWGSLLYYYT